MPKNFTAFYRVFVCAKAEKIGGLQGNEKCSELKINNKPHMRRENIGVLVIYTSHAAGDQITRHKRDEEDQKGTDTLTRRRSNAPCAMRPAREISKGSM